MLFENGWANDNLVVINFKKRVMNFENRDMQIIAPLDPSEGGSHGKMGSHIQYLGGLHPSHRKWGAGMVKY